MADDGTDFFEKSIRPVLIAKCYSCHSADAARKRALKAGLQLDTRAGIRAGGESGPAVVPGDVAKSLLVGAIRHESFEMPPDDKLPDNVIADFVKWIELGAPDTRDGQPIAATNRIDYAEGRRHWAYQPLRVVPVQVKDASWPRGEIDRYILARIEAAGLQPAADARPHELIRRVYFDLIGLPPELKDEGGRMKDERTGIEFDPSSLIFHPSSFEKLVDQLLESPRFGEHWARHWLDGIRFNPQFETSAYYRNWVIQALNDDLPYNEFLRRQIAGDLIEHGSDDEAPGNVIATQMLTYNRQEADFIEASLEVLGQQMFGISFNCAKCHDHKFDAVSQEDYYALAGILNSCQVPKSARDGVKLPGTGTQIVSLFDQNSNRIGPTHLLLGGDKSRPGELIPRRLPKVFFVGEPPRIESTETSGRLELADWAGDPRNPLTARVMANRIWQRLMGRGIVPTPNDFGTAGDPPTHPELLDYLASRLIESGWSVKAVVREVVLSRTYQQSVQAAAESFEKDYANELYTRAMPKRLQFEQIMDQLLAVAGKLELGMVEPVPSINKWPSQRRSDKTYGGPRTIYARPDDHTLRTFDGPDPELLVVERERSVTAPQALHFLNSDMLRQLSDDTAKRLKSQAASDEPQTLIADAYRLLFARLPNSQESELGAEFIQQHGFVRLCPHVAMHE